MPSQMQPFDDPPSWAGLLNLDEVERFTEDVWRPEELGAVFRHQMSSPVRFDLHNFTGSGASDLKTLCAAEGLLIRSFADLFHHPNPPIELLIMTKRFGKISHNYPDAVIPKDIARVLYYASILVALVRCKQRITELDDHELAEGVQWALNRPWLDNATRELLYDCLQKIIPAAAGVIDVPAMSPEIHKSP